MGIQRRINQAKRQIGEVIRREGDVRKRYNDKLIQRDQARKLMDEAWEKRCQMRKLLENEHMLIQQANDRYKEAWNEFTSKSNEIYERIQRTKNEIASEGKWIDECVKCARRERRYGRIEQAEKWDQKANEHRERRRTLLKKKDGLYHRIDDLKAAALIKAGHPDSTQYRIAKDDLARMADEHERLRHEYLALKAEAEEIRKELEGLRAEHERLRQKVADLYREKKDYYTMIPIGGDEKPGQ